MRTDGSDVRVLWELNRLGHFITLARAYSLTNDERYSAEFFAQLRSWAEQNPYGRGPNWTCAMEVALRAINLLGAFETFRHSPQLNTEFLSFFLQLLQQHGNYIHRNLEFSYIATSNHYLSDVVGLLWLGLMLPELRDAHEWRDLAWTRCYVRWTNRCWLMERISNHQPAITASLQNSCFTRSCFAGPTMSRSKSDTGPSFTRCLIYIRAYLRPEDLLL